MLRMPVTQWREEFANTLDTVLRKKWDQVVTDTGKKRNILGQIDHFLLLP